MKKGSLFVFAPCVVAIVAFFCCDNSKLNAQSVFKKTDTMETLDIPKMMKVIDATALAIINLK